MWTEPAHAALTHVRERCSLSAAEPHFVYSLWFFVCCCFHVVRVDGSVMMDVWSVVVSLCSELHESVCSLLFSFLCVVTLLLFKKSWADVVSTASDFLLQAD